MALRQYLKEIVYFVAGGNPIAWREIWNNWNYSEVVEFALQLSDDRKKTMEQVDEMDYEYSESYTVALLNMLVMKR